MISFKDVFEILTIKLPSNLAGGKKSSIKGLGDDQSGTCLPGRHEFDPQNPHKETGELAHAANPSAGEVETGGSLGSLTSKSI